MHSVENFKRSHCVMAFQKCASHKNHGNERTVYFWQDVGKAIVAIFMVVYCTIFSLSLYPPLLPSHNTPVHPRPHPSTTNASVSRTRSRMHVCMQCRLLVLLVCGCSAGFTPTHRLPTMHSGRFLFLVTQPFRCTCECLSVGVWAAVASFVLLYLLMLFKN